MIVDADIKTTDHRSRCACASERLNRSLWMLTLSEHSPTRVVGIAVLVAHACAAQRLKNVVKSGVSGEELSGRAVASHAMSLFGQIQINLIEISALHRMFWRTPGVHGR